MQVKDRKFDNFDQFAEDYRKIHSENLRMVGGDSIVYSRNKADLVKSAIKVKDGHFLDFGCGDGIITEMLAPELLSWKFFGVDVSEESIEIAKKKEIENASFQAFDGFLLPFENNFFDVIFVANVFHHVAHEHHPKIVSEFLRVLKNGGNVYFFEHNPFNPVTRHIVNTCPFDKDAVLLKPGYAKQLFEQAGFSHVSNQFILFFPRHKAFRLFWNLETFLNKIPLGGQYFLTARK